MTHHITNINDVDPADVDTDDDAVRYYLVYARQSARSNWHLYHTEKDEARANLLMSGLYRDCQLPRSFEAWHSGEIVIVEWIGSIYDPLPDNCHNLPAGAIVKRVTCE